jgi:recombination protein RecT
MANEVAKKPQTGLQKFNAMLENTRTQEYLTNVLGEKKQTFVSNMVALVSSNKALSECDPSTIMFSCLKATALSLPLDPSLGLAWVLPYKDNKNNTTVATFQLGAKAYIQLALRTAQYRKINVRDVREGEIVGEDFVSGEMQFKKLEKDRSKAQVVGYVAMFELINGFSKQLYMSVDELDAHAKRFSQTYRKGYGLWSDKEMRPAMMEKTILKRLLSKYGVLSVEMEQAIKSDSAVLGENDAVRYIDNEENAIDLNKAQAVADKFAGFADAEEVKDQGDNPNENQ